MTHTPTPHIHQPIIPHPSQAGTLTLERQPFDVLEMLRAVDAAVRPRAEEKGVKFKLKATRDVAPSDAVGDRARLEQVALQLCENALRFTKEGEICIEMTVAPDADGGGSSKGGDEPESYRLVLAVIDSGWASRPSSSRPSSRRSRGTRRREVRTRSPRVARRRR